MVKFKHAMVIGLVSLGGLAYAGDGVPTTPTTPVLIAQAPEWREDFLKVESTEETPFYNHVIGTMCGAVSAHGQANAIEAIQRFRTREAAEQFRGEHGEGLSVLKMDSPLMWVGATALAHVGVAAQTRLYGQNSMGLSMIELPVRGEKARVPVGSRKCQPVPSSKLSEEVLSKMGLADSPLKNFTRMEEGASQLQGEIPALAQGIKWTALLTGDGVQRPLSLSTSQELSVLKALWEDVSHKLEPLGLRSDLKMTFVNGATTVYHRIWNLADGRTVSAMLNEGFTATAAGASPTFLLSISPAVPS